MTLKLNQLKLLIETEKGSYGSNISFENGLVVLRANNSSGKSICIQAIIYALGLEKMLGARSETPFPHVMTEFIEENGNKIPIISSYVFLEICNEYGKILTIQRKIKNKRKTKDTRDFRLISTWNGPYLSSPCGIYEQEDFFVRDGGAAKREQGFHHKLASFIGWDLPNVKKYDGSDILLYMECIFPLIIIEQKHGWSGIQSNMPKYFGVQEVYKRSIEFLLDLEAYNIILKKQQLKQSQLDIEQNWNILMAECKTCANSVDGLIYDLPDKPNKWYLDSSSHIMVYRNEKLISLEEAIKSDSDLLACLESKEISTIEDSVPQVSKELDNLMDVLKTKEVLFTVYSDELMAEKSQIEAIDLRLESLEEDLRKNQDILKIKNYGSIVEWNISSGTCPTCHQHISDSLLSTEYVDNVMSIEDNISFIKSQIEVFKKMRLNSQKIFDIKESQLNSSKKEISETRSQIRAIKKTLVSDERLPSISEIRKQISISENIRTSREIIDNFENILCEFSDLANEWKYIEEQLEKLPKESLSVSDKRKISELDALFKKQLKEYDFSSLDPDSLRISDDDYKPLNSDGFNLGFDVSASDNIRIIWAYNLSLLELARKEHTNHPRLLIFDEPRQQGTDVFSFNKLLKHATNAIDFNQQIIFATSDPKEKIIKMLNGNRYQLIDFPGKIIQKI